MQNNQNYSKLIFQDENRIVYQNYQVINDKIIYPKYSYFALDNVTDGEYVQKQYTYFKCWLTDMTNKHPINVLDKQATTFNACKGSFKAQMAKEYIVHETASYIDVPIMFYDVEFPIYVKNAYSDNTNVRLVLPYRDDYKIYKQKGLDIRIYNIESLLNSVVNINLEIYSDLARKELIGNIDFTLNIVSSNNPSGD